MTTTVPNAGRSIPIGHRSIVVEEGVYRPQHDSQLLIDQLEQIAVAGRTVVDLCTGSAVVAIAAVRLGAAAVTAWDICPRAVRCARHNAAAAQIPVAIFQGPFEHALDHGPYDIVLANPPYVPTGTVTLVESGAAQLGLEPPL